MFYSLKVPVLTFQVEQKIIQFGLISFAIVNFLKICRHIILTNRVFTSGKAELLLIKDKKEQFYSFELPLDKMSDQKRS